MCPTPSGKLQRRAVAALQVVGAYPLRHEHRATRNHSGQAGFEDFFPVLACVSSPTFSKHGLRGVETTESGGLWLGKMPSELRVEPRSLRYGQITGLTHMSPIAHKPAKRTAGGGGGGGGQN